MMEHSSRPGDRQHVMNIIRKNILSLSCPKPRVFLQKAFFLSFLAVVDFGGTEGRERGWLVGGFRQTLIER